VRTHIQDIYSYNIIRPNPDDSTCSRRYVCMCVCVCDIQMDGQSWVWALMLAYFLFLGPFFVVGTFLNFVAVAYNSSAGGCIAAETVTETEKETGTETGRGCGGVCAWLLGRQVHRVRQMRLHHGMGGCACCLSGRRYLITHSPSYRHLPHNTPHHTDMFHSAPLLLINIPHTPPQPSSDAAKTVEAGK
jgi:hypothetical protein